MKRVGILRGGASENYENSIRRGGEVLSYFATNLSEKYKPVDILIDRDGVWHMGGLPIMPSDLIHKVDVVWNVGDTEHGSMLNSLSIPNLSKGSFSQTLENSREILRQHMKEVGVPMPRSIILSAYQEDIDGPREKYAIKRLKRSTPNSVLHG
ncbi:hypothetical protein K2P96_01820 [Patescibacteria group bacterium]|nr:hypothetical protein [Patescibacteria group bacterium]